MALVEGARESHWLASGGAPPYPAPACRMLGGPAVGRGACIIENPRGLPEDIAPDRRLLGHGGRDTVQLLEVV